MKLLKFVYTVCDSGTTPVTIKAMVTVTLLRIMTTISRPTVEIIMATIRKNAHKCI